jgi:predicted peptidase
MTARYDSNLRKWIRWAALTLALPIFGGCNADPSGPVDAKAPRGTGFVDEQVTVDGNAHKFAVFVPFNYSASSRYPTIVFLHGLGETGSDGHKNLTVGLGPEIAKQADNFPFIVIFPQTGGNWGGQVHDDLVMAAIQQTESKYAVDPDRIVLTGLSTGGYGTWAIGARHNDLFAALVPMCAYDDYADVSRLVHMPIWVFHNSADPFVSSGGSREMVKRLKAQGGDARITVYDAFGHDCWTQAYADPELFPWIAAQRRK